MTTSLRHSSESWNLPVLVALVKKNEIPAFAGMTEGR